eukprot:Pgem_evm1s6415
MQQAYLEYKQIENDIIEWQGKRISLKKVFMVNMNTLKPITVKNVNSLLKGYVNHILHGDFNNITVHILRKHFATYAYK